LTRKAKDAAFKAKAQTSKGKATTKAKVGILRPQAKAKARSNITA